MTSQRHDERGPREVELKIGLPSAEAHARLRGALDAAGGFVGERCQENLFFDGPDAELSAARLVLRVRIEHDPAPGAPVPAATLTLKAEGIRSGEIVDRPEIECALPLEPEALRRDPSGLLRLDLEPVRELVRRVPGLRDLRLVGGFGNARRLYRVALEVPCGPEASRHFKSTWELDRCVFPDGSADHELEVEFGRFEWPGEAATAVHAELARLGIPTTVQLLSKYARLRERQER